MVRFLENEIQVDNCSICIPNLLIDALKEYAAKRQKGFNEDIISYADLYCFRSFVQTTETLTQRQYNEVIKALGFPNDFLRD